MAKDTHTGNKIRQIREERNLTVDQLAGLSQVGPQLIHQLEEGLLAPSLAPLMKIARALGVRLGTFLDDAPQSGPVVVSGGRSDKVLRFSGDREPSDRSGLDFFSLAAEKKDRHMEPFFITVRPGENAHPGKSGDITAGGAGGTEGAGGAEGAGKANQESKLSEHEGEEFIYVLEGSITVHYGKDTYELAAGDSIYYDSVVPHYVHTTGEGESRILAVIYAPM